jgi:hypothetical protein
MRQCGMQTTARHAAYQRTLHAPHGSGPTLAVAALLVVLNRSQHTRAQAHTRTRNHKYTHAHTHTTTHRNTHAHAHATTNTRTRTRIQTHTRTCARTLQDGSVYHGSFSDGKPSAGDATFVLRNGIKQPGKWYGAQ